MDAAVLRFACTQCGRCCNRSPEVELSEAAALADVFVFRLMFRLYRQPRAGSGEAFFQRKRFLGDYAARKRAVRVRRDGRTVDENEYLIVSALSLETGAGTCSALAGNRCGIYHRRPFACRTVPLHYTAVETAAASELAAFVATPGYACDTSDGAPAMVEGGQIVDADARRTRADAVAAAACDDAWKQAIVRRLKAPAGLPLPSVQQLQASADHGALTSSMRPAWKVAVDAGLMTPDEYRALLEAQLAVIERELALGRAPVDARQTLGEMRTEYTHWIARS